MSNTVLADVKDPNQSEQWVDMTLKCAEVWDPADVDFVQSPAKAEQCGLLEDADGEKMRFVSWTNSNPPYMEEGETYDFTKLFLVYGRDGDDFKLIFRSDTAAESSGTDLDVVAGEGECPYCSANVTDEHYHEGPGAPEVGWEYYTCPNCDQNLRPEVV